MEAATPLPPAPPIHSAVPSAAIYSDSIHSSPRSLHTASWDADLPILPQKLRFMCSYGGHIIPRPHDKSLCYIGGDTRIIVIDRNTSLSDLRHRLSKTLLQNQPFLLKYQLPNEDLDALISVTADEDLEIMVEEYDRLNNTVAGGGLKPGRLRLFLFPKSASNIEQLLVETASTKSDDWFLNAINGKTTTLSAAASDLGFSESSSVNCLLGLEDDFVGKVVAVGKGVESQTNAALKNERSGNGINNNNNNNHEVHSIPGSPMLETTSSFGSTSSSPSSNLPPIKVHLEENPKAESTGIEEQFQQMGIGVGGNVNLLPPLQKQEEVGGFVPAGMVVSGLPSAAGVECGGRTVSDVERSDHGGYRKIPQFPQLMQPQQIAKFQPKPVVCNDFPSPDSVSSEGSITNPLSRQRHAFFQEPMTQIVSGNYRAVAVANPVDSTSEDQNSNRVQMQPQVQESGYMLANQFDQNHHQLHQQPHFVHTGAPQFIHTGAVPIASYYPIYPTQQQHPHQPELDQQHPVYFMPTRPVQAFNLPLQQTNYSEMAPTASSVRPQTSPAVVASHGALNQARNAPNSKPELTAGVYRTAAAPAPQLIQVPPGQHQAHYVGFTQIHHPSQSVAQSPAAGSAYTYELGDPTRSQIYYAQHLPPQLAAQFQTMAPAPGMALPDSSAQLDNMKH